MHSSIRFSLLTPKAIKDHLEKTWQGYIAATTFLANQMPSHLQFLTLRFDVATLGLPVAAHWTQNFGLFSQRDRFRCRVSQFQSSSGKPKLEMLIDEFGRIYYRISRLLLGNHLHRKRKQAPLVYAFVDFEVRNGCLPSLAAAYGSGFHQEPRADFLPRTDIAVEPLLRIGLRPCTSTENIRRAGIHTTAEDSCAECDPNPEYQAPFPARSFLAGRMTNTGPAQVTIAWGLLSSITREWAAPCSHAPLSPLCWKSQIARQWDVVRGTTVDLGLGMYLYSVASEIPS
jgi:hypothetical protein